MDDQEKIDALGRQVKKVDNAISNPLPVGPLTEDERYDRFMAMVERATEEMTRINQELCELLGDK